MITINVYECITIFVVALTDENTFPFSLKTLITVFCHYFVCRFFLYISQSMQLKLYEANSYVIF